MEKDSELSKESAETTLEFSNVLFFLVYLMTTKEEQESEIEKIWLERMRKDLESDIFINYDLEGIA